MPRRLPSSRDGDRDGRCRRGPQTPNVHIDTSAYATKRLPAPLISLIKTRTGQRKVLFGTNYPMMSHAHALRGLDELGLTDEARLDYLHGNAQRIFTIGRE